MRSSSLRIRSLLLVLLPLIFQLIFVCVLMWFVGKVQVEWQREDHSRNIIIQAFTTAQDTYKLMYQKQFELAENTSEGRRVKAIKMAQEVRARWERLFTLTANDEYNRKTFKRLRSVIEDGLLSFKEWVEESSKPRPDRAKIHEMAQSVTHKSQAVVSVLKEIAAVEKERTKFRKSPQLIADVQRSFPIFVALTTLATIALAVFFSNSVRNPLIRITANSRLFSQRKPLMPPLARNDELGELDRLIHNIASSVYTALEHEQDLLNSVGELVCSIDGDGVFTFVNPYCETMLLMESDELIGRPFLDFVWTHDVLVADQNLKRAKSEGKTIEFDLRLKRSDAQVVETRWSTFWSAEYQSLFCVVLDITEQKNIERLKQDFVNMVSHDLRSPLMSIHASMTLISAGAKGEITPEIRSSTADAANAIDLLTVLVNDLLDFQKLQEGKIQLARSEFQLDELLKESSQLLEAAGRKKRIQIIQNPGTWSISADQSKLRQTILNLLSNAIKFSPVDGKIWIDVEQNTEWTEIRVIDQGPGIPAGYEEKIFDAFEQVPDSGAKKEGAGLGLAICKLIATAHGGTTGIYSGEDAKRFKKSESGSVFWIRIPR